MALKKRFRGKLRTIREIAELVSKSINYVRQHYVYDKRNEAEFEEYLTKKHNPAAAMIEKSKNSGYNYKGEYDSIAYFARKYGIIYQTLLNRISEQKLYNPETLDIAEAIERDPKQSRQTPDRIKGVYEGQMLDLTYNEWAELLDLSHTTVRKYCGRLTKKQQGMTIEKFLAEVYPDLRRGRAYIRKYEGIFKGNEVVWTLSEWARASGEKIRGIRWYVEGDLWSGAAKMTVNEAINLIRAKKLEKQKAPDPTRERDAAPAERRFFFAKALGSKAKVVCQIIKSELMGHECSMCKEHSCDYTGIRPLPPLPLQEGF